MPLTVRPTTVVGTAAGSVPPRVRLPLPLSLALPLSEDTLLPRIVCQSRLGLGPDDFLRTSRSSNSASAVITRAVEYELGR
jgi:hypothetical protein